MLIEDKKKYLILFLTALLLIKVLSCDVLPESTELVHPRCESMNEAAELTFKEINSFLDIWAEYVKNGYDKEVSDKVSLISGDIVNDIPLNVKLWFNSKCWVIKRFYYVEDRLRAALHTLYLKRHSAAILAILNERMTEENEEQYKQMIEMQNKIANIEQISDEELKMVESKEAQIIKILNAK